MRGRCTSHRLSSGHSQLCRSDLPIQAGMRGRDSAVIANVAATGALLQVHPYCTTLVAGAEYRLSTPAILNDVATNS